MKREIISLREGRASFGRIAAITGVGRETIKSWCRRNSISPRATGTPINGVCEHAGKPSTSPGVGRGFAAGPAACPGGTPTR